MGFTMCLAIPARVLEVHGATATVEFQGQQKRVDASLVTPAAGDFVLLLSGVIIEVMEKEDALAALQVLEEIGATR